MSKLRNLALGLLAGALLLVPAAALAQGNVSDSIEPGFSMLSAHQAEIYGAMNGPGWVQSYAVSCSKGGSLRVQVRDCCMPGDHFEASARTWDRLPTTVRILASGSTTIYRGVVLSSFGSKPLRALVNVRYLHGINVFPAGFYIKLTCSPVTSVLTYTDEGQVCDTSE